MSYVIEIEAAPEMKVAWQVFKYLFELHSRYCKEDSITAAVNNDQHQSADYGTDVENEQRLSGHRACLTL